MPRILPLVLATCLLTAAEAPRLGDAGVRAHADRDQYYPQVAAWAEAGVDGGIPAPAAATLTVAMGEDLAAALAACEGGVVELAAGEHPLAAPLHLRDGVILRGQPGAVLVYGAAGLHDGIVFDGRRGAGVQSLTLRYADPQGWGAVPTPPGVYANRGQAPEQAAIRILGSRDCWLSDVAIEASPGSSLHVTGSSDCTLRALLIADALNRGVGHGEVYLADCERLLLVGWQVRGIRGLVLDEPLRDCVFAQSMFGAGIRFSRARGISRLLVEDCHFLLPPGHPWRPFSKWSDPLGPDSLVMDCSAYHHGTDAVVGGVLMENDVAYVLQQRTQRGPFDAETLSWRTPKLVARHQTTVAAAPASTAEQPTAIAATWSDAPDGALVVDLDDRAELGEWLIAVPLPSAILAADPGPLATTAILAGSTHETTGTTPFAPLPEAAKVPTAQPDPLHVAKMQAKFGVKSIPPEGAQVDALAALGGDWTAGAVLSCVLRVPGEATVQADLTLVGCRSRIILSGEEITAKQPLRLAPGFHPLLVLLRGERKPPFIKAARWGLRFELLEEARDTNLIDTPKPEGGSLLPWRNTRDELAEERPHLDAWWGFFKELRQATVADIRGKVAALQALDDSHVAWLAGTIAAVLADAPHDEGRGDLTPQQWAELAEYYAVMGMPERKWAIGKAHKPPKLRIYYPEEVLP